jgi:iron complex outermembrane receptor protein
MLRLLLSRGVCAGALALAPSSLAMAQQTLPTIEIGGVRGKPKPVPGQNGGSGGAATGAASPGPNAGSGSSVASRFASVPRTPTEGYVVHNVTTGAKMDVPLRELPVSVGVVPRQVIVDQNTTLVQEALENVSGVQSNNTDTAGYNFNIRGFQVLNFFRNNLKADGFNFDTANIERIEVLKGPASVLYGRSEPGGIINLITKEPLGAPRYVLEQQFGSFNYYRTQWDLSAPIDQVEGLAYRVSGAYQNNGSFRTFQGGERVLVAPVIAYRPTEWTDFTLDTQYFGQRAQSDVGIPTIGPAPAPVPLSRSFQEPTDPIDSSDNVTVSYRFRQNLNEDWKVTNRFLYAHSSLQGVNLSASCSTPFCVDPDWQTLQRLTQTQTVSGQTFSTNIDLEGKFLALGGRHNFLMGLDYYNNNFSYYAGGGAGLYPINIVNPVYGGVPDYAYWDAIAGSGFKYHSSTLTRQKGFYVQDLVTYFERLHILLGARYDVADQTAGFSSSCCGDYTATQQAAIDARLAADTAVDTAWSPRAGFVLDVLPQVSVYANYSRSFGVGNGFSATGAPLGPQRGLQWEAGLKAEPLPGLNATLAFYQITKSGVPTRDFAGGPGAFILAGLQRSRGVELDVLGAITDRLAVTANYAYIDAKVIADNPFNPLNPFGILDPLIFGQQGGLLGRHRDNVPRHSGKVFLTYDFGDNGLGFRVGGGVTAATRAWGDIQNTFLLPGWARLDAFASYATLFEGHKLTAQLNLKNINNAQYFVGPDNFFNNFSAPYSSIPAKPFTATGTVRMEF